MNSLICVLVLSSLFDSRVLAYLVSKVVKLRTSNSTASGDFEFGNVWRMERESSLDSNTRGNLSNGDGFSNSAVLNGDAYAFKQLNSLFAAFTDFYADLDGISGPDFWQVGLHV